MSGSDTADKSGIVKKMADIQRRLHAPKSQTNKFGGYQYRSCEDILQAAKPLLAEHGLVLTITDEIMEANGRWYVRAKASVSDGTQSIESNGYAREEETKKGMDAAQITGAASSYARKYALNGLFAIDDTKDADSTNEHKTNGEPKVETVNEDYFRKFVECCKAASSVEELDDHGKTMRKTFELKEINEPTYQKCRDFAKARRVVLETEAVT